MGRMEAPDWRAFRDRAMYWIAFVGPRRLVIGIVTTCLALVMLWLLLRPSVPPLESVVPQVSGVETANSATVSAPLTLTVHVAGAVKTPGVYVLSSRARVVDAVTAAGGALATADLEGINLAQTINDTEQIYIPLRSRRTTRITVAPRLKPTRSTTPSTVVAAPGSNSGAVGVVNVNSATVSELDALPGVGPATAKAIIDHRTKKGPFTKVEDLLNVTGIGPSKLAALRDQVSV
jgi:competence protein ComEA